MSAELDAVCLRALDRDVAQRYASEHELATKLSQAAEQAGCLAPTLAVADLLRARFGDEIARGRAAIRACCPPPVVPDDTAGLFAAAATPTTVPVYRPDTAPEAICDHDDADWGTPNSGSLPLHITVGTAVEREPDELPQSSSVRQLVPLWGMAATFALSAFVGIWLWSQREAETARAVAAPPPPMATHATAPPVVIEPFEPARGEAATDPGVAPAVVVPPVEDPVEAAPPVEDPVAAPPIAAAPVAAPAADCAEPCADLRDADKRSRHASHSAAKKSAHGGRSSRAEPALEVNPYPNEGR